MTRRPSLIEAGRVKLRAFLKTPEGAEALFYLRAFTVEAVPGPDMSEPALRFHGGKCALVKQLENLADERDGTDERHDDDDD